MPKRFLILLLLAWAFVASGCASMNPRLRSAAIGPLDVGFEVPPEALAQHLAASLHGRNASRRAAYGQWQTDYQGGDSFTAALSWGRHAMTTQIRVTGPRVEFELVDSKNLNAVSGRIHRVAASHLRGMRNQVARILKAERVAARKAAQQPTTSLASRIPARPSSPAPSVSPTPAPALSLDPGSARPRLLDAAGATAAGGGAALDPALRGLRLGRYHALVIGNNHYSDLPVLRTPVPDAAVVSSILELDYGFDVQILANATRSQIVSALNRYRAILGENDNLLVYYAGHGWFDREANRGYWLPIDATQGNPANWLSNVTITDLVRAIPAKHVMVVADSCYSGTLTRGINMQVRANNYLQNIAQKRARTVLTSGGLEPVEDGSGKHSVFAGAFIEALRSNASVMDGQGLFSQIRRPVMLESDQTPEYGDIRQAGHDGGDFLFVRQR